MTNANKGFTALFSVIIISFLLLSIAITINFSGFFSRFNILDSESKSRSSVLAKNCLDHGRLVLSSDIEYTGAGEFTVNGEKCNFEVLSGGVIRSWASVNKSSTFFRAVLDLGNADLKMILFEECPDLYNCS